jgi:DNA modification methylase
MEPAIIKGIGQDPPTARLYYGIDVRKALRELPEKSIQTVCTSPPFWSLRYYHTEPSIWGGEADCEHEFEMQDSTHTRANPGGESDIDRDRDFDALREQQHGFCKKCNAWKGNLGLEPDPLMYVKNMVEIFSAVKRVLRDDGTVWLNLGDTYWAGGSTTTKSQDPANYKDKVGLASMCTIGQRLRPLKPQTHEYLKPKDLVGIPWRVALALQADGWWLRNDIIWARTSGMPESMKDRCTRSHSYIFLLAKRRHYFYDADAIRNPMVKGASGSRFDTGKTRHRGVSKNDRQDHPAGSNRRSVWYVNSKPYPGAHFAVWPPEIVEPMILAGTSDKGACLKCGAPWRRVVEQDDPHTTDWEPTCACPGLDGDHPWPLIAMHPEGKNNWPSGRCTVLDPFAGTATTGKVALQHNRNFIGIERNAAYRMMAQARILDYAAPEEDPDDTPSVLDFLNQEA